MAYNLHISINGKLVTPVVKINFKCGTTKQVDWKEVVGYIVNNDYTPGVEDQVKEIHEKILERFAAD